MKKYLRVLSYILTAAAAAAIAFTAARCTQPGTNKLDELKALIDERFIGDYDDTEVLDAAADAMVEALGDRWSYYIAADDYAAYQEQMANAYVGIGVTISAAEDGSGMEILSVTAGSPALEAGLQAGDIITAADGTGLAGATPTEAKNLVRGEEGTEVMLTIRRDAEEIQVSVVRRELRTQVASGQLLEGNIGLVKIENFDSRCADESIAAIEELLADGAEALIFDVRWNPGGYASELVELLDYLLPEGDLFRTVDYAGNEHTDRSDADCLDIPMAVLVNGSSYSAAEFFAAALSEYEAAVTVGEQTCGKGYFQNTFKLSDGSAVGLSVGKYYTPKGNNLAGVGITPDIVIEVDDETAAMIYSGLLDPEEDPQIRAAVEALAGQN